MAERMSFFFDREADILYVSIGKRCSAISKESGDDVLVRINPRTQKVVGFTILNLTTRFKRMKHPESLPIAGELVFS